ncbi:hypothetical protein UNH65_10880 [Chitinophaga sp. 180180018-2]|nr:hypothetical protein [Chitinophaga sp. 212800010-3]
MIMKLTHLTIRRFPILFIITVLLSGAGCRKADKYYNELVAVPEIYTSLGLDYSRFGNGASRQYHVGDTLLINGRFGADSSQLSVTIGGVKAIVASVGKKDSITNSNNVSYYNTIETIRVPLTEAMGQGGLSVQANCRGFVLNGPVLFLVPKGSLPAISGPLVWKQLLTFQAFGNVAASAALTDSFLANPVFYPSCSGTGNVFFSKKSKIQLLHKDGSVEPFTDLQNLKDNYGDFSIVKMYNGAVDQQEHFLYFSALTADRYKTPGTPGSGADADSNIIFRYCKLDLQSKQLVVVNRTLVPSFINKVTTLGNILQIQSLFTAEGPVSQVNLLPFTKAWADNDGNLYFIPSGFLTSPYDYDQSGKARYYPTMYNTSYALSWYTHLGKITPDGKVQYLLKKYQDWPGVGALRCNILSLDVQKGILYTIVVVSGRAQIWMYDLNNRAVITSLFPSVPGAGAIAPFRLLDPITPAFGGAITYSGLIGEQGRLLPLPGSANRFLYDLQNVVYDFSASETYKYAPAMVDSISQRVPTGGFYDQFNSNRVDLLSTILNFDSEGNLYKIAPFYTVFGSNYSFYYDVRRTYILKQ